MPQTPLGLTYPASGDHTRLWEHFQSLAEGIDALLAAVPIIKSGTVQVTLTNGEGNKDVAFATPFPSVPNVLLSAQTGSSAVQYQLWASNISATGFRAHVWRGNNTAMTLHWVAVGAR